MGLIIGFIKAILGICKTQPLNPELWNREDSKLRVRLTQVPELSQAGGAVYLDDETLENPVLVVRARDDEYLAFKNACPHLGRKIDPVPGEPFLRCCSVMHSTFDYEGRKISGPADGGLTKYQVELEGSDLIIWL
jgi:Rieske Fe-S protein